MKTKNKWPNEPDSREVIRRLNWFMHAGFRVDSIQFSCEQKEISMSGDCRSDDVGLEYIEGGPFHIKFIGVRNFSIRNLHQVSHLTPLFLEGASDTTRNFTIEKDLSQNRYYHLKTFSFNDCFGFEIDFDDLEIQQEIVKL